MRTECLSRRRRFSSPRFVHERETCWNICRTVVYPFSDVRPSLVFIPGLIPPIWMMVRIADVLGISALLLRQSRLGYSAGCRLWKLQSSYPETGDWVFGRAVVHLTRKGKQPYRPGALSRSIATSADDSRDSGKLLMAYAAAYSVPMAWKVHLLRR